MGNYYYVNRNETCNPGHHHEVHTQMHIQQLDIRDTLYLGFFTLLDKGTQPFVVCDG